MSFENGWAALNLEKPERVPRTEYSATMHWDLIKAVTGVEVSARSDAETHQSAEKAFMKAWNYDFIWSTLIDGQVFGDMRTKMGHAEYAAEGADFDDERSCAFSGPDEVLAFDPWECLGPCDQRQSIKDFEEHYRRACEYYGDAVNMTGTYVTCISGLIDLFGWDNLLLALGQSPREFGAMTNRYASWMQQYFDALAASDVPVVMVHDDIVWTSGAFCQPDWYRHFVFPNYKRFFQPLQEAGKKIIYTSDGNYTEFLDDVVGCGVQGVVMEPTTDMAYFSERYGKTHVFIGNADTRILLGGDRGAIRGEVERCMNIGKDCPGFFMAVGNHIPPNTPVENAIYYNEVYEELSVR